MNLDYKQFFYKATGFEPFPYQNKMATRENFPELLKVPTGAGKTAGVVLPWVWRKKFEKESIRIQTPRRLIYCLPMRVLVEQTYESVIIWLDRLGLLAGKAIWKNPEEKTGLIDYSPESGQFDSEKLISVHILMGGEDAGKWDEYPEKDSILIGTQDMLLSRALNRGYASSRFRWPLEFGLLNNDCLWVMDEVQLMGAGLPTSIQMESFRQYLGTFGNHSTIWMSATCEPEWIKTVDFKKSKIDQLSISPEDAEVEILRKRLTAFKKLKKIPLVIGSEKKEDASEEYIQKLSTIIWDQCQQTESTASTIVILNTVKRAQDLYKKLTQEFQSKSSMDVPEIFLLHGRFRLPERAQIFNNFKVAGDESKGKILISTQVIEAGVDISAHTLITELAPWSSLVQRFGRLNRYGEYNDSTAFWIDIDTKDSQSTVLPYNAQELDTARMILNGLQEVSPQTLDGITQPSMDAQRHVIRLKDLIDLFDTTADLTGNDIDISRFIRDSDDRDVSVYWRNWEENKPPEDYKGSLKEELCQVPIIDFKDFLDSNKEQIWSWDYLEGRWIHPIFNRIYPGHTFLIHSKAGGYDLKAGWSKNCKDYVPPVISPNSVSSNDSTNKDQGVASRQWETIAKHADNTLMQMEKLLSNLEPIAWEYAHILKNAAYYHDIGKAHNVFQEAILSNIDEDGNSMKGELWAKSNQSSGIKYQRKHFRHELVSALLLLQNIALIENVESIDESNLLVYLVAAHHGKVRLSIRSVPGETVPNNLEIIRFARGAWEGDTIPEINLENNKKIPSTILNLSMMEIGTDEQGNPSWLERMCKLRDSKNLGPFRLSYLEGLVRVADWRASSLQGELDE